MVRDDAVVDVRIALGACFGSNYSHTNTHACIHTYERQCFYKRALVRAGYANSLTLICRGNTEKKLLKHSVGGLITGRPKLIESREMQ